MSKHRLLTRENIVQALEVSLPPRENAFHRGREKLRLKRASFALRGGRPHRSWERAFSIRRRWRNLEEKETDRKGGETEKKGTK